CKPRVANREDSSGLQTTEVHAVMMETEPGDPTAANIEEEVFGRTRGYPTERRPIDYRRDIDHDTPDRVIDKWFSESKIKIGPKATGTEVREAKRLLYTWRDLFAS